ncbi:MAG: hypothetical protein ACYDEI_01675 [Erysipelotrichaceae bacterium]|jgi:hypothetical protein
MKHWQERIPTINLILINLILVILIVAGFIIGPINRAMQEKNSILLAIKEKVKIDSCYKLDSYTFEKELFTAKCKINENDFYLFVDKNGIVYERTVIDFQKEQDDYSLILDKYQLDNASYQVIFYKDQIAYWIKSKQFEYVLEYNSLDIIMKVRF